MIRTVSTAATIRRSRTLLATSFQRGSGVAPMRLRMPFSRCWTSGIGGEHAQLHEGHGQDARHEVGDGRDVLGRQGQLR